MNHVFYSYGNAQKITWIIQNDDSSFIENREHIDMYKDKVTNLQSKYVALHIGLFWGIGTFIIKNEDNVKIKLDEKIMFDQFTTDLKIEDVFIQKRLRFIKQLIDQRKLKIEFEVISKDENIARNKI
ncbi:MAG: hypothetical protein OEL56_07145 [Nitrosopumilus sp.]|nr:hypothetical protein [Nitrosopumilus sp.]MDH3490209.1 hypothetical protein [Nitrosopumilus sp.]MDH3516948.1 hypothetical protein [Nitrosopumilus sp.]MDH3565323.1 hypothetical protein [Nitrosopumilus sp.]MDH5417017.1 hypothetical protein [Nitrosopumilus sp.]